MIRVVSNRKTALHQQGSAEDFDHAKWLLVATAIGCLSGVVLPAYWVGWSAPGHPWAPLVLPIVAGCLVCPLVAVIVVGIRVRKVGRSLAMAVFDIVFGLLVTMVSWFIVPPAALVGLWLLAAGLIWRPSSSSLGKSLRTVAFVVIVVPLAASLVLPFVPTYADVLAPLISLGLAVWVAAYSGRFFGTEHRRVVGLQH